MAYRTWGRIFACLLLIAALNVSALAAGAEERTPTRFDEQAEAEDCLEAQPAAASVGGVTDDGRELFLDIHFVLDGISISRANEVLDQMRYAYDPLNITLRATYQEVSFEAQRMEKEFVADSEEVPVSDTDYLFDKMKTAVGGVRPPGSDVVYLLTDDQIAGTVAGMADCIGGIRYPRSAFAIGEEEEDGGPGLYLCCTLFTSKVAAHEVAHLLGAHHHYANCVEGAATKLDDQHLGTCTMMFNDVGLVNLRFSALEAAVVRGHVLEFGDASDTEAPAEPAPEPAPQPGPQPEPDPDPDPQPAPDPEPAPDPDPVTQLRSVEMDLVRHLVARGRVRAANAEACFSTVAVALERRTPAGWKSVDSKLTADDGSFRFKVADRAGRYRVRAPGFAWDDGGVSCAAALSPVRRHRHA